MFVRNVTPALWTALALALPASLAFAGASDSIHVLPSKNGKTDVITIDLVTACDGSATCTIPLDKVGFPEKSVVIQGQDGKTFCFDNVNVDGLFGTTYDNEKNNKKLCLPANPTVDSPVPVDLVYWYSSDLAYGPTPIGAGTDPNDKTDYWGGVRKSCKFLLFGCHEITAVTTGANKKHIQFTNPVMFDKTPGQIAFLSLRLEAETKNESTVEFYENLRRAADALRKEVEEAHDLALDSGQVWAKGPHGVLHPEDAKQVSDLAESLLEVNRELRGNGYGLSSVAATDLNLRQEIALMLNQYDAVAPMLSPSGHYNNITEKATPSGKCKYGKGQSAKEAACDAMFRLNADLADIKDLYGNHETGGPVTKLVAMDASLVREQLNRLRGKLGVENASQYDGGTVQEILNHILDLLEGSGGVQEIGNSSAGDADPRLQGAVSALAAYWNSADGGQKLVSMFDERSSESSFAKTISQQIEMLRDQLNHLGSAFPGIAFNLALPVDLPELDSASFFQGGSSDGKAKPAALPDAPFSIDGGAKKTDDIKKPDPNAPKGLGGQP